MNEDLALDSYLNVYISSIAKLDANELNTGSSSVPLLFEGGAYQLGSDDSHTYIANSGLNRFGATVLRTHSSLHVDKKSTHCLNGKTLYGGPLILHYGHFITESISRLWAYDDHQYVVFTLADPFKSGIYTHRILPAFARDILRILKIPLSKIVINAGIPLICSELEVPQSGFEIPSHLSSSYLTFLSQAFTPVLGLPKDYLSYQKTYVSRSRLDKGLVAGEIQLEKLFFENGFSLIYPEFLPILDVVKTLSMSSLVSGINGTGLHNVLFSPIPPKSMIQFRRRKGWSSGVQTTINRSLGINGFEIDCLCNQFGSGSRAIAMFDLNCLGTFLSDKLNISWNELEIDNIIKNVQEEYDLLQLYSQLKDSQIRQRDWPPDIGQITRLSRLIEIRRSPGIALFVARAFRAHGITKKCLEALYSAHVYGATNDAISSIQRHI